jgi:hypothetical protein
MTTLPIPKTWLLFLPISQYIVVGTLKQEYHSKSRKPAHSYNFKTSRNEDSKDITNPTGVLVRHFNS